MSITIKSLKDDRLNTNALANIFTTTTDGKAAVVRNIRFVNPDAAKIADLTIALVRTSGGTAGAARVIAASPVSIPPKGLYVVEDEVTLEFGAGSPAISDAIQAKAVERGTTTATAVDFVISGIERDL